MANQPKDQSQALSLTSSNSEAISTIVNQLERVIKLSHPDRVLFTPSEVIKALEGEEINMIIEGIDKGLRGEYGDVYRIDGIALLSWVTKRKKEIEEEKSFARQMGFGSSRDRSELFDHGAY